MSTSPRAFGSPATLVHSAPRIAVAVAVVTFGVYAATAARTITFWEGAHYPLLARTLSIANPPGSLLLTLIGRLLGDVPFAQPMAFRLNLIAALIGAATAAVVARVGTRVACDRTRAPGAAALAGGVVAALTWGFAATPWTYATQFTPYGLSALFTALILGSFIRWWHRAEGSDAIGNAALIALLLGLDVSVHRANLVLVTAVVLGALLGRPRVLARPRFLAAVAAAFVVGVSLQLLYIPLSLREPFLDTTAPNSLGALWGYERLDIVGGGFLMDVWPRRADFVRVQLGDLAHFARANLGGGAWGWPVGATWVLMGWVALVRRSWRLALALAGFALAAGLGVVAYLNRPLTYFRTLDRHYLAFLVTLMPLLAAGVAAILEWANARAGRLAAGAAMVLLAALPLSAMITNVRARDLSRTRFAETFARDLLEPLPQHALLLTNGDNDSFPPWYLQQVEGVRPDVTVVNASVAWTRPGTRRIQRADPALASFAPSDTLIADLARRCLGRRPVCFAATLVVPSPIAGISDRLQLEGLSWRVVAPGEQLRNLGALERFVHDRLPRAGLDDPRQRLDDDLKPIGMSYAAAAFQLANALLARGDGRGALATIEALDRYCPEWPWPRELDSIRDEVAQTRRLAEAKVRGR